MNELLLRIAMYRLVSHQDSIYMGTLRYGKLYYRTKQYERHAKQCAKLNKSIAQLTK